MTIREDLGSIYTNTDKFDSMMKRQFYLNFTSATNSEQELIHVPFPYDDASNYTTLNDPMTPFSHWKIKKSGNAGTLVNADGDYENAGGRKKACKSLGLTGKEKRACASKIKQSCGKAPMFGKAKKDAYAKCVMSIDITEGGKEVEDAKKELQNLRNQNQQAGLSTGAKVGLAIGAFSLLSIGLYFAFKSSKKIIPTVTTAG